MRLSLADLGERMAAANCAHFIPRRRGAALPAFTPARQAIAFRALLPTTDTSYRDLANEIATKPPPQQVGGWRSTRVVCSRHRHIARWHITSDCARNWNGLRLHHELVSR